MVQLKAKIADVVDAIIKAFQFQYGTIKRERGFAPNYEVWKFQFQYGTIKRLSLRAGELEDQIGFQFQYGTIKSRYF